MSILRAPFVVKALRHTPRNLQITWKDGVETTFPSSWLRSNVRDSHFFDKSMTYKYDHFAFVNRAIPISSADQRNSETIEVKWSDHTSDFNASWLRAQDVANAPEPLEKMDLELWDQSLHIPQYDYKERGSELLSWMKSLKKWGIILINGVPRSEMGFTDVMHMIGPLRRRYHPTDILRLQAGNLKYREVDPTAYGLVELKAHIDHTYLQSPAKIIGFLCLDYSAPDRDTVNYFANSVRVAEDLRKSDPEAFQILSSTEFRRSRRRIGVEEDCDPSDERIYDWDTYLDSPVIVTNKSGEVTMVRSSPVQNAGHALGSYDGDHISKFYSAYSKLVGMLESPKYHAKLVLKPGSMFLFDNQRLVHGRSEISPSTSRTFLVAFLHDETWKSRWRILLGRRSGLADKWLFGCSEGSLEILSQHME